MSYREIVRECVTETARVECVGWRKKRIGRRGNRFLNMDRVKGLELKNILMISHLQNYFFVCHSQVSLTDSI